MSRHILNASKPRTCSCTVPCRSDQSGSICIDCSIPICIHTWSAAGNSLQLVGALSKQSATDHLSWSSPSFQESVFLVDILLTDSRCRLLGRKHASYVTSVLIGLEEWLRMASASEQTCPTSPHQHLQLCWIGHTS